MGLIYTTDIATLSDLTITSRAEATGHEDDNVLELDNLSRDYRSGDLTANNYLVKFDFGSATTLVAVVLLDVNFDAVKFQGDADDAWGAIDYQTSELTPTYNKRIRRYNIYIPVTFNYRYGRIFIPTGAGVLANAEVTDSWKIGSVLLCYSTTTLTTGMVGSTPSASQRRSSMEFKNGRNRPVKLGNKWKYSDTIRFPAGSETNREEILDLLAADDYNPGLMLYYNNSDTSEVYFGTKDPAIQTEYIIDGTYVPGPLRFTEYI